ncbi:MAG: cell division topological specificity factor MinE [Anaerolineae bacterium CFX3]|jgi:cell division topological specificity factor|nr:cell division topological specificity factor MinE [Anaerolineae bacterium]MBL1172205.1 cell division topological specificity factor MinE [Chloroflexota bacterium]MBW7918619.1 cell division topological specificity factor MinE [Anaerolineales bacterium]MCE7904933.1 cell division topological specificity factor MinE [Anaerolineae bacterium CFX3]MDL1926144.1 cell division topological specificity factor MinE [Anaerolineae bacterium AMX1]OQY86770.1 MAG: cell division topological specificity factor
MMFNFFKPRRSAASAKERLQLVLIHDRTDLTPDELNALKDDLLIAISKYVEIEPSDVRIGLERDGRSQRLVADIPLRSMARRRAG